MGHAPKRYLLVPRREAAQLLLLPGPQGWTLPSVTLVDHFYPMVGAIAEAAREEFGIQLAVLRWTYRHPAPERVPADRVYATENLSPDWQAPAGARWVTAAELQSLELAIPEHRQVAIPFLQELATRSSSVAPWARPGWYREASGWIEAQVARTGGRLLAPVEQIKSWTISCLMKVETDQGALYFKASPDRFAAEIGVTAGLAPLYPDLTPWVVAEDRDRKWGLMRAFEGRLLAQEPDLERWCDALRIYARMQLDFAGAPDRLRAMGCADRRLEVLLTQMAQMLADTESLVGPDRLTAAQLDEIRQVAMGLQERAAQLEAFGLPYTLEHGDLHPRNIAVDGARITIFDWSDACLAHPFFSLHLFLDSLFEVAIPDAPEIRLQLRDAYLEPWSAYGTPAQLAGAFESARQLAAVHYALSYYWYLIPAVDEPDEWFWGPTHFLKKLLATRGSDA